MWTLLILPRAQRELSALDRTIYPRLRDAIHNLANDPRPPGCRKLTGRDGWRIRVADYRVIMTSTTHSKASWSSTSATAATSIADPASRLHPSCSYDLRATLNRCPECGHIPSGVPATQDAIIPVATSAKGGPP